MALVALYAASEKLCRLLVVGFVGVLRSMRLVFFGKDAPLGWLVFFLQKMPPLVGWWFFFKRCPPRLVGGFSVKDPPLVGWWFFKGVPPWLARRSEPAGLAGRSEFMHPAAQPARCMAMRGLHGHGPLFSWHSGGIKRCHRALHARPAMALPALHIIVRLFLLRYI